MALFGSLIIFSLVIHVVISADCDKTAIPDDDHGKFVFKPDETTIPNGGSVTVFCTTAGYESSDGDGRIIRCINGTWEGTLHTCKPAKCPKQHMSSPPMDHGAYQYKNDSGVDSVENGTLASVECDKGYQMMKKTANDDYELTEFSDNDAFFCHYSVWVGRKAIDLGYRCDPKCLKQNMSSPPMDHSAYKFKNDSGEDFVENGTLATVECDEGYRMMKKTASGDYKQTEFSDNDAFFCNYSSWVGRKAIDLGYRCDPMGKVLVIGASTGDGSTIMELYDTEHPENNDLVNEPLPASRYQHMSGVFDDGIVAIVGGIKDYMLTMDTDFYNPKLGTFVTGPPLAVVRMYPASVMLNNEMIVCGGRDKKPSSSCEKLFYDESSEAYKWITLTASMNHARAIHAMTKFKNDLFVFGGDNNFTAERYVKATNTWDIITPMPTNRWPVGAATLSGIIYICGDNSKKYKNCEKYDPVASNWVGSTAPMITTGSALFNLVAMEKEGKLYAFGLDNVQWFDPTTGHWTSLTAHMMKPRKDATAVQLKPN